MKKLLAVLALATLAMGAGADITRQSTSETTRAVAFEWAHIRAVNMACNQVEPSTDKGFEASLAAYTTRFYGVAPAAPEHAKLMSALKADIEGAAPHIARTLNVDGCPQASAWARQTAFELSAGALARVD